MTNDNLWDTYAWKPPASWSRGTVSTAASTAAGAYVTHAQKRRRGTPRPPMGPSTKEKRR